jgi:hypothetical protein
LLSLRGLKRVQKKANDWSGWEKNIPQGIKGWVKTHPYQPTLIMLALCGG